MPTKNKPSKFELMIAQLDQVTPQGEGDEIPSISPPRQPQLPGGVLTLMDIKYRKPLPDIPDKGRRCLLYDMIAFTPDTYTEFIMMIRGGAYFHVAAEACGIGESTMYEWARKGRDALASGQDTYYTRFLLDVRKAVAHCRASCEMTLKDLDPKRWLTLGPGKIFGNQWTEPSQNQHVSDQTPVQSEDGLLGTMKDQAKIEGKIDDGMTVVNLDPKQELDTILALEAAGQGQWPDEYKESLRKQIKEVK